MAIFLNNVAAFAFFAVVAVVVPVVVIIVVMIIAVVVVFVTIDFFFITPVKVEVKLFFTAFAV